MTEGVETGQGGGREGGGVACLCVCVCAVVMDDDEDDVTSCGADCGPKSGPAGLTARQINCWTLEGAGEAGGGT